MIYLILFLGLLLRLFSLNQSLWLDEAINVLAVKNYSLTGIITQYLIGDFHPPVYSMLLWFWTRVFGTSEVAIRIPSVIFGTFTIYLIYLLGKKLHSKNLGLVCALLLAVNPLHVYYSQEARMYALAVFAVCLNMLLFINLAKQSSVFYILSNILVLMSDYVAILIFPAQFFFILLNRKAGIFKKWFLCLLTSLVLVVWWVPVFIKQLSVGSVTSANLPAWKFIVGGFDIKAVPLTLVKFIIGRISLADKFIYYLILFPVCSLFLFVLFKGIKFVKGQDRNLLITWITVPILLATLISFVVPVYSYFRLLYVLPAVIILIVLGVISCKGRLKYMILGVILIIQLFSVSVYLFNSSYQREDWRGVVDYLESINKESLILFESSGTLPPFDYYAKNKLNARGALKDFPVKDINEVNDLSFNTPNTPKDIYLVDYLVDISDPNRLVSKKLINLGYKQSEIKNFTGVGFIYHYVMQ